MRLLSEYDNQTAEEFEREHVWTIFLIMIFIL